MNDEGALDPWVSNWMASNSMMAMPIEDMSPELLELARGPMGAPPTREIFHVTDELVGDIPIRIYSHEDEPTGVVVYFHGGGFVIGSIGLMDNVARQLAYHSGAVVISVGYRLAPEHPFPAGLQDCESVTRWALANMVRFGAAGRRVAVAGESAGGNLAASVTLRLGASTPMQLCGQVLMYPGVAGSMVYPSMVEFDGLVIDRKAVEGYWRAYGGGRDIDRDPFAAPLHAQSLAGLPPALVVLGGCDMLRDEGRAYAVRLREEGVEVTEVCYPGQPHGFINFEFPAAGRAFDRIGTWLRVALASTD